MMRIFGTHRVRIVVEPQLCYHLDPSRTSLAPTQPHVSITSKIRRKTVFRCVVGPPSRSYSDMHRRKTNDPLIKMNDLL